jgi:hypothetical protein
MYMSNEIFFKEYAKGEKPPFHIFKETLNQNVRGSKMETQTESPQAKIKDIKNFKFYIKPTYEQPPNVEQGFWSLLIKKDKAFMDLLSLLRVDTAKEEYINFSYGSLSYKRSKYRGFFVDKIRGRTDFFPLLTDDAEITIKFAGGDYQQIRNYYNTLTELSLYIREAIETLYNLEKEVTISFTIKAEQKDEE